MTDLQAPAREAVEHEVQASPNPGDIHRFRGVLLGSATSRYKTHGRHPREYADKGVTCGACRWTEVAVYRVEPQPEPAKLVGNSSFPPSPFDALMKSSYLVHRVGRSVVPGEADRYSLDQTYSPYEVVEFLTVKHAGSEPYMPPQHSRALAQAAIADVGLRDAYVNRAVA